MKRKNNELDQIIREKLEHLEPPFQKGSWELLERRLDALEEGAPAVMVDKEMDAVVFDRLHQLETRYNPQHWRLLLARLEAEEVLVRRVLRYKAMELSIVFLLFLAFARHPALFTRNSSPGNPQVELQTKERPGKAADRTVEATPEASSTELPAQSSLPPAPEDAILPATASARTGFVGVSLTGGPAFSSASLSVFPALPSRPDPSPPLLTPGPLEKAPGFKPSMPVAEAVQAFRSPAVPSLLAEELVPQSRPLDVGPEPVSQPIFIRVGTQGGVDYNRVITPPTDINGESYALDRYSLGYSGGLVMGFERNRWEVETGLIYTAKKYYPLPILLVDGSVEQRFRGEGFKNFELNMVQVPLNFRYNFLVRDRWRLYGLTGLSMHLITQSNYYLADPEGFASQTYRPEPVAPGGRSNGLPARFDNFSKGWLEGGTYRDNTFFTTNAGVGIERFVTHRLSLYAQPTYYHSVYYLNNGKLGPLHDRIHTMSLFFGVKVRM